MLLGVAKEKLQGGQFNLGPFSLGGDIWYLNILIVLPSAALLLVFVFWVIAAECTKRRYRKIVTEAEVKI